MNLGFAYPYYRQKDMHGPASGGCGRPVLASSPFSISSGCRSELILPMAIRHAVQLRDESGQLFRGFRGRVHFAIALSQNPDGTGGRVVDPQWCALFSGLAMTDVNSRPLSPSRTMCRSRLLIFFRRLLHLLGLGRGVINDERYARGEPPLEKVGDDKILV